MQTVVMSFGRNQSLGKPGLPIHHLHVYFPAQLVHKLVERMDRLRFTDVTPEDGKKYRRNSESEANSPYIVWVHAKGHVPPVLSLPFQTRQNSQVHMNMIPYGNLGQMASFQSTYKSMGNTEEEEEEKDDTYVPPDGQGCFSFRQSLLLRAKDTYAARSNGNKHEIISKWLLTGLAVVLSRPNWQILAKRGTLTSTPQELLKHFYQQGHPAGLADKTMLPYALPWHNAIPDAEWQRKVEWFSHARYLQDMEAVNAERTGSRFDAFYKTMSQTNPSKADQEETEQTNAPAEPTTAAASTSSGPCPADKPTIASAVQQSR